MKTRGLWFILLVMVSCTERNAGWSTLSLSYLKGDVQHLQEMSGRTNVFIFLSPECPLCRSYSLRINELQQEFESENLKFTGVVSGSFYPDAEISEYLIRHGMKLPVLLDPEFKLAKALNATITPEVFVTDPDGKVMYSGAIDNWAIALGQKRLETTEHYLRNALINLQQGLPAEPAKTKAIGCFIE